MSSNNCKVVWTPVDYQSPRGEDGPPSLEASITSDQGILRIPSLYSMAHSTVEALPPTLLSYLLLSMLHYIATALPNDAVPLPPTLLCHHRPCFVLHGPFFCGGPAPCSLVLPRAINDVLHWYNNPICPFSHCSRAFYRY